MSEALPVVDMSAALRTGDYSATAHEIGQAARDTGFFYLKGHGIAPDLMESVFAQAARFFALPAAEKEAISIRQSPHNRGYVSMQGESLDPAMPADLKEAFNIGWDLPPDDPRVVAGEPFRGVNLWPDLPGWRDTMLAYFDAVWSVGRKLHRAIAIDIGLTRISSRTSSTRRWPSCACFTTRRSRSVPKLGRSGPASIPTTATSRCFSPTASPAWR
jgi:isopenicillin N synthase-like dioxygenase